MQVMEPESEEITRAETAAAVAVCRQKGIENGSKTLESTAIQVRHGYQPSVDDEAVVDFPP